MIYTIGDRDNYLAAIQRDGIIQKLGKKQPGEHPDYPDGYPGGYAFQTLDDALRGLREEDQSGRWTVFGMDANWEQDTEPDQGHWWHSLKKEADIIVLPET